MGAKTDAKQAVRKWVERNKKDRLPIRSIRHVHPRVVVVGYAAPLCLVVRRDWRDAEKHMREFERENPLDLIHTFDRTLREGDACVTAYVFCDGIGESIAVRRAVAAKRAKAKRAKTPAASEAQKGI